METLQNNHQSIYEMQAVGQAAGRIAVQWESEKDNNLRMGPQPLTYEQAYQIIDTWKDDTALQDHGHHRNVIGRQDVIEHEEGILKEWAGQRTGVENEKHLHEAMGYFRMDMQWFSDDPELSKKVDEYFNTNQPVPEYLRAVKITAEVESNRNLSWTEWLASVASDEQLLNFLEWHNYTHEQRDTDPAFQAEVLERKKKFIEKARDLRSSGMLHEDTSSAPEELAHVKVTMSDIFHSYMFNQEGFSHLNTSEVEVVEGGRPELLWHELKHQVLERPMEEGTDDLWVREAIAEHTALVMENGNESDIDPDKRVGEPESTYRIERKLLAKLMEGMPLHLITRYYSASSELGMTQTKLELEQAFTDRYGHPDMIKRIGNYIDLHSTLKDEATRLKSFDIEGREKILEELAKDLSPLFK
jgi:hypothetical protein